jgi:NAD(P)-dependent dehydrogenase (short-subunit alcohol dehydrogenase family)
MSQAFVGRGDGDPAAIVNVASVHAFGARAGFAAYAAAKAALLAFTRAASLEWGPRVRVNAVAPGFVAVERNADLWQDPVQRDRLIRANPLGRLGQPGDVAAAVAFLASDEASFITGAVLPVDGGLLAKLPEEPS